MSILDDAIREHLELKRAHGADEAELKKLEDEAFGPPGRPGEGDPMAEAPTEFLVAPEVEAASGAGEPDEDAGRRRINVADLQEPPPGAEAAPPGAEGEQTSMEQEVAPEPTAAAPDQAEADQAEADPVEPPADPEAGHTTAERHAIAEQPTEFFDVEAEIEPAAGLPTPSDEEIVDTELAEPRLAPGGRIDSDAGEALDEEEDDDFWNEQRLSDELDQALEAPVTDEHELPRQVTPLTDEHELPPSPAPVTDEHDEVGLEAEEHEEHEAPGAEGGPEAEHEDVLEDTPDFLEDAPEDDELWFEQRPPKDFDFDD